MKLKICLMGMLCLFFRLIVQAKPVDKPLQVGDAVPDLVINNIINYKYTNVKISDFKGKILILDFWATWCGNCIESFPALNEVQKSLPDKVQILLVDTKFTRDKPEIIRKFFSSRNGQYQLPSVMMDTVLDQLFPHHSIPHEIWIRDNKVIAITDESQITVNNVSGIYNNDPKIQLEQKGLIRLEGAIPSTVNDYSTSSFICRSVLSGFDPKYQRWVSSQQPDDSSFTKIDFVNFSRMDLINSAWVKGYFRRDRIVLNVKDQTDYSADSSSISWKNQNCFNYELAVRPTSGKELYDHMRSDMEQYFHVKIDTVVKLVKCFQLTIIDPGKVVKGNPLGHGDSNILESTGQPIFFYDSYLNTIGSRIEEVIREPFIMQNDLGEKINLQFPANLTDRQAVKKALLSQGVSLTELVANITFLRISDIQ
jgi:thiol-disulfide isomerase/thioredoxin